MATTEVEQHVMVRIHDGVGLIQLNRPEKMNAIGALTRRQLGDAIKQVERDDAVRVVVLTGSGRAFCSGADVTEMAQGDGGMRTPEDVGNVLRNEYMPMLTRLRTMPKPVIAAMNGPAVGIGASYALACDIRIAVPEAYLLEAFIKIGLALAPPRGHWCRVRDVLHGQASVGHRRAPPGRDQPRGSTGALRGGGPRARNAAGCAAAQSDGGRQARSQPRARVELRRGPRVRVVPARG